MPCCVHADIIPMLRHLVKALQPFARNRDIGLSFQSDKKQVFISYCPELVARDTVSLLSDMISFLPGHESISISTSLVAEGGDHFLKIIFRNTGICLLAVSEIAQKCKLPIVQNADGSGTRYVLELRGELSEPAVLNESGSIPNNRRFLPAYYNEIRKRLRPHITKTDCLLAALSAKNPKDASFLQKVNACIQTNIEEDNFDANRLSEVMRMSRAQLYRRLKPLVRQAPGSYIKSVRLQKAKELLETSDMRVGEVAYKTGFQTPSHFTRVFIHQYGVRPSLFCRRNKNETKG
jgi:AraC-like DNA-binding protein